MAAPAPALLPRWLRPAQAAAYAGVSESTLRCWGLARHTMRGRRRAAVVVLYDREEIDTYVERHAVPLVAANGEPPWLPFTPPPKLAVGRSDGVTPTVPKAPGSSSGAAATRKLLHGP